MRLTAILRQSDRRMRHHMMLDGQINPREWFNWHPKEYLPNAANKYDLHKFIYERHQFAHLHHLLCHQVYLADLAQLTRCPEPTTFIIDCRMDPAKMRRWVPHSHWLPRDEVEYALQLRGDEFLDMYGFSKPDVSHDVILISHDGVASEQCGWEFKRALYHHVYNYRGGTNEYFSEEENDFSKDLTDKLKPWKGPYPQHGIYTDVWSKRKLLTRTGPFDRQYELQNFQLPDLELEKPRHPETGPRSNLPYGLQ